MKSVEVFIKRPVLATMINLVLILLGVVCFDRLTVREYPNIDVPVVTIDTGYRGANARIIESQVTKPLEDSISGIEGIDFISSISRAERSQITVQFKVARDIDAAASDVRDRVGRVRKVLPDEVDEPVIARTEADAQPIIWLGMTSDTHTGLETSEYADRIVQDRLQVQPGVASVMIVGEQRLSMRVNLDRDQLAAYSLTVQDIENAIRAQNVEIPAGRIENIDREFTVLARTDINTPAEFRQIILRADQSQTLRLGDVASVDYGPEEIRRISRFKGKPSIGLGVIKQSTANPLTVSQGVQAALPQINKLLPKGMKVEVAYDSSVFIEKSIEGVYSAILESMLLVGLVILFFFRSLRLTLIPLATLPVCMVGTFALMYLFGFTINTLTLLAMVLAIGLVVDDAIVILENTERHIENGMKPVDAAIKGIREIGFAVLVMTISLAVVFVPIALTPGRTGKLFTEFAITLAAAVMVSGFTALTLTPMMCAYLLKSRAQHTEGKLSAAMGRAIASLDTSYRATLDWLTPKWLIAVLLSVVLAFGAWAVGHKLPHELSPSEDRGVLFGIVIAPEGATVNYTDRFARQIEGILASVPEYRARFIATGFPVVNQAFMVLLLKPWEERTRTALQIIPTIMPQFFGIPSILAFPVNPPSLGQSPGAQPINFVLQTTGSYEDLDRDVQKFTAEVAAKNPQIQITQVDLKLNKPEIKIDVDREKLASLGISVDTLGRTIETMMGGREVTRFKKDGEQYDVIVRAADSKRTTANDMRQIFLRAKNGDMVQLSNLVTLTESVAPKELNRFNKLRSATISANLNNGYALGEALAFLDATAARVTPHLSVDYGGQSREYKESAENLALIFGLALAFIFMVLAAQFESYRDPMVIMLTVPLAMAGAFAALSFKGFSLNVYSQIGLVTLIGLITKHGILIVEFANQLREEGLDKLTAIKQAAEQRLRPIVMTTAGMILGAFPLAFATGAGSEARQQIGWVIVGGMTLGTLLTLFVVPSLYLLVSKRDKN